MLKIVNTKVASTTPKRLIASIIAFVFINSPLATWAAETDPAVEKGIFHYIAYSDRFASSGQPSADQLKAQKAAGVERVIYIAFSDQKHSLPAEDRIAKELGLNYLHIPVDWTAPQKRDYYLFAQAMLLEPERKTLLHCQANYRATAFALLYRVLENDVPLATAKADMNSIWVPNSVWTNFILDVLKDNNVATDCENCDWTPSAIGE